MTQPFRGKVKRISQGRGSIRIVIEQMAGQTSVPSNADEWEVCVPTHLIAQVPPMLEAMFTVDVEGGEPTLVAVQRLADPAEAEPSSIPADSRPIRTLTPLPDATRFIHAYNFVGVPREGLGQLATDELFGRSAPASHDRFHADRLTGFVECRLTTRSEWFIPDARKANKGANGHKSAGWFTLDDVPEWRPGALDDIVRDRTTPAVPASSLRGMVRSIFETLTASCFSQFDDGGLDIRVGFDPAHRGGGAQSADRPSYVPVRVVDVINDGSIVLEQLDGRAQGDDPQTLRAAFVPAYAGAVRVGHKHQAHNGSATGIVAHVPTIPDGAPVVATIKRTADRRYGADGKLRYCYRRAHAVMPLPDSDQSITPPLCNADEWIVFGYLHRTGPNIEKKHDERLFFDASAPFNAPDSLKNFDERLKSFWFESVTAIRPRVRLDANAEVVKLLKSSLTRYFDRHRRALYDESLPPTPRVLSPSPDAPYPSDFLDGRDSGPSLPKRGSVFYALLRGDKVVGLYPVALPRLAYPNTRGELLCKEMHPCRSIDRQCPACRVFGWVKQEGDSDKSRQASAGHLRFSHGMLNASGSTNWAKADGHIAWRTLPILGAPRPTTTAFYLRPVGPPAYETAKETRWPPILKDARASTIPHYRVEEASLSGRKMYRRVAGPHQSRRPDRVSRHEEKGPQNQTITPLPSGLQFTFRVDFDNLTKLELGALLTSLTLQLEPDEDGKLSPSGLHGLGRGKPLGLGCATIAVTNLVVDDLSEPSKNKDHRCRTLTDPARRNLTASDSIRDFLSHLGDAATKEKWVKTMLDELKFMCADVSSEPKPDYPPNPVGNKPDHERYQWFVSNRKSGGHLLPDPVREIQEPGSRLPKDPRRGPK